MDNERLYDVRFYHVDKEGNDIGGYNHGKKMNSTPMSLRRANIFRRKMMDRSNGVFRLVVAR